MACCGSAATLLIIDHLASDVSSDRAGPSGYHDYYFHSLSSRCRVVKLARKSFVFSQKLNKAPVISLSLILYHPKHIVAHCCPGISLRQLLSFTRLTSWVTRVSSFLDSLPASANTDRFVTSFCLLATERSIHLRRRRQAIVSK